MKECVTHLTGIYKCSQLLISLVFHKKNSCSQNTFRCHFLLVTIISGISLGHNKRSLFTASLWMLDHSSTSIIYFIDWQVVKQCCATDGVEAQYIKDEILPDFFKHFWQHRMALDRRNYRQVWTIILIMWKRLLHFFPTSEARLLTKASIHADWKNHGEEELKS